MAEELAAIVRSLRSDPLPLRARSGLLLKNTALSAPTVVQAATFRWGANDEHSASGTRPKVGDRLRVVADNHSGDGVDRISISARVGDIVTITKDDKSGLPFEGKIEGSGQTVWSRPTAYDCTKREAEVSPVPGAFFEVSAIP